MKDWKTTLLGVLAIGVGVGSGLLRHMGYDPSPAVVEAILALVIGGGFIVAKDSK